MLACRAVVEQAGECENAFCGAIEYLGVFGAVAVSAFNNFWKLRGRDSQLSIEALANLDGPCSFYLHRHGLFRSSSRPRLPTA